jgi:hypothetical protein
MAAKAKTPASAQEVREWAAGKGISVKDKGRLPAAVKTAFTKATKREIA